MGRYWVSLLLLSSLAAPGALAEGRRGGKGMRGPQDPMANMKFLTQRLKLDQNQQTQIQPLVEDYAKALQDLGEKTPQDLREQRQTLMKEMAEARKAKDKDKMKEIAKQLGDLRKNDPQAAERDKLRQDLATKIEPLLRDDQKQALQRMTQVGRRGKAGAGSPGDLDNPGFLKHCLMEIPLRPDQQTEIKKIDQEFREASKNLGKDAPPEKRKEMGKQYRDEVTKLLDPNQKQQLEEIAQKGPNKMMPFIRNPKALDKALAEVQLRPDQKTNIDAMKERYKADRQAVGKDPKALMDLNKKLVEDVMAQLDDAQKAELAKAMAKGAGKGAAKGAGKRAGGGKKAKKQEDQ
ncbi:MAG: hypothetical protein JXQ73_08035 [Phycisphaerae bacterium]|nr:hypothetical protein [Phycisphaerae bacterium]